MNCNLETALGRRPKIMLVTYHMGRGGAERVLSIMANHWAAKGYDVSLVTFSIAESSYPLDPRVRLLAYPMDAEGGNPLVGLLNNARRVKRLRQTLLEEKPDAVISFMHINNVRTLLAARGLGIPVVISERSNPYMDTIDGYWDKLRSMTYPSASRVVLQTRASEEFFTNPEVRKICAVVPNPIPQPLATRQAGLKKDAYKLVSLGRLVDIKGFDKLITAFAPLASKHPDWSLTIYGEGPARQGLEKLVSELALTDRVNLPGKIDNTHEALAEADLYALTSDYEGFPNALAEALSVGLPAVSLDCKYGPADVIREGVDGYLVPAGDVAKLTQRLDALMSDDAMREHMAAKAPEILDRFSEEQVMLMWEEVLCDVVQ